MKLHNILARCNFRHLGFYMLKYLVLSGLLQVALLTCDVNFFFSNIYKFLLKEIHVFLAIHIVLQSDPN